MVLKLDQEAKTNQSWDTDIETDIHFLTAIVENVKQADGNRQWGGSEKCIRRNQHNESVPCCIGGDEGRYYLNTRFFIHKESKHKHHQHGYLPITLDRRSYNDGKAIRTLPEGLRSRPFFCRFSKPIQREKHTVRMRRKPS